MERGREGERERERGRVIMGMVESFREKEGKEQKKNGKKNAILSKNMPIIYMYGMGHKKVSVFYKTTTVQRKFCVPFPCPFRCKSFRVFLHFFAWQF